MSQLNVLSTENINIYKKFKLDNGNLYIDNEKIGIETFGAGKSITIKDNIIDICQNIDLSNVNVVNYVQIGENTFLYGDGIRKSILTGNLDICGSLMITSDFTAGDQNYGSINSFQTIYLANIENSVNMNTITISSEFIDASNSNTSINILIANTLDVSDTTEINGILDASTIFFRSGINATNINICGDVIFNEDISFNHDIFINGNVDISNNVDICNNAIIKYDISVEHLIVYGDLIINGTLDTSDNYFVTNIIGNNTVFGKIDILNLDLSGTTTLTFKDVSYIDASNSFLKNVIDISVENLELSNTIHVKENIIVDGSFNFRNYIGNYSSISGEIILSNHVDISNSGSGPALSIYHDVDDDIVLFKNNDETVFKIDTSGNSDFYYDVDISSLIIEKNTSIKGNVSIHQNLDISNDLVIEGTIYNVEKIDISNNVNIYGNMDISHDYKTNPVYGNKNYFNLDIDGSGLEINIEIDIAIINSDYRIITTYSIDNLDVSNIILRTETSESITSNLYHDRTITITDLSNSYTIIQIGDEITISSESFTDISYNIEVNNGEQILLRRQIDISNHVANNGNKYNLSFDTFRINPHIDNCFNSVMSNKYSNEFHSNIDISINSSVDNSYCFSGRGTMPMSGIIMWSGSELPDGWAYCDGENGTPDLRGRFIMSSTYQETITINSESATYNIEQTGGFQTVTLGEEEMPSHSHSIDSTIDFSHNHIIDNTNETAILSTHSTQHSHTIQDYSIQTDDNTNITDNFLTVHTSHNSELMLSATNDMTDLSGGHVHNVNIQHNHNIQESDEYVHTHNMYSSGNSEPHDNLPPYYVLAFIMRIR